jgi:The  BURPS668_1122 family of deaminases
VLVVTSETLALAGTPEPNNLGDMVNRNIDTEYKILSEIAEKLGSNTNATGKIRLFTERAPCNSCSNVINLFSNKYTKIEIEIIHNNGNILIDF